VADEVDVRGGVAAGIRQRVGIKHATDLGAGFAGDLLHQPRVRHVFEKHRRNLLFPDCADDGCDVLGRCLAFRRDALRRSEMDAIGCLEITEGVVAGDDAALVGRDLGERIAHLAFEHIEAREIAGGIRFVIAPPGWIGRDQCDSGRI
jgi:hypothetical protein